MTTEVRILFTALSLSAAVFAYAQAPVLVDTLRGAQQGDGFGDTYGNRAPLSLVQTFLNPDAAAHSFYGANFAGSRQSISTDDQRIPVGTVDLERGDANANVYRNPGGGFVLEASVASPEPGNPVSGTMFGQSVNFLGNGRMSISQMGYASQGGGRMFIYELP